MLWITVLGFVGVSALFYTYLVATAQDDPYDLRFEPALLQVDHNEEVVEQRKAA